MYKHKRYIESEATRRFGKLAISLRVAIFFARYFITSRSCSRVDYYLLVVFCIVRKLFATRFGRGLEMSSGIVPIGQNDSPL